MTNNTQPQLPAEVVECINNWIVTFALAYHRRKDKDISNDAAEYITDELKMPNAMTEYATKLHQAMKYDKSIAALHAKCDRYEKALKDIELVGHGGTPFSIAECKRIANEALAGDGEKEVGNGG